MTGRYDRPRLSTARLSAQTNVIGTGAGGQRGPAGPMAVALAAPAAQSPDHGLLPVDPDFAAGAARPVDPVRRIPARHQGRRRGRPSGSAGYRGGAGHAALIHRLRARGGLGGRTGGSVAGGHPRPGRRGPLSAYGRRSDDTGRSAIATGRRRHRLHRARGHLHRCRRRMGGRPAAARRPVRAAHPGVPGRAVRTHRAGTRRAPTCWPWRRRGPASRTSTSSP